MLTLRCATSCTLGLLVVALAAVWKTCWEPIRDVNLLLVPPSDAECGKQAAAGLCPVEGDLSTLDSAGFAVLRRVVDPAHLRGMFEKVDEIPSSRNQNVNGTFLESRTAAFLPEAVQEQLGALVDRAVQTAGSVSGGRPLHMDSLAVYATGRPGWPAWRQVPYHQDHESLYWYGSASFLLLFLVAEKEDPSRENIDFVSFEALERCNPALRHALEGSGASISLPVEKALNGSWRLNAWQKKLPALYEELRRKHQDSAAAERWPFSSLKTLQVQAASGTLIPSDIDMDHLRCTPSLDVGDVVLMRADVLHQTQDFVGRQTRRLILAAHYVDIDTHGLSMELLRKPGPVLLRGLAKNPQFAEAFGAIKAAGLEKAPIGRRSQVFASAGASGLLRGWVAAFHLRFRAMNWMVEFRESMILAGWTVR